MASKTNLSTNLDYVSWSSGDGAIAIFAQIDASLKAHGWSQASSVNGANGNTYDPTYASPGTHDFRRVYSASLTATNASTNPSGPFYGSGLSTKYVMVRIVNQVPDGTAVYGYQSQTNVWFIQLIPFISWNSGNDTGTTQAGQALSATSGLNGAYDSSNPNNVGQGGWSSCFPYTWISTTVSGFLYIAASAKWICMWPYFVNSTIFNGPRNNVLMYGEIAEDFASYTGVAPVYVTTLQKLAHASGATNEPALYVSGSSSYATPPQQPQFIMPATPASTTGYTGLSNTIRSGYQAMGTTRVMLGHYGWFGWEGANYNYDASSTYSYQSYYAYPQYFGGAPVPIVPEMRNASYGWGKHGISKQNDPPNGNYTNPVYRPTRAQSYGQYALNTTNLKGIEPIFGGGGLGAGSGVGTGSYSGYVANPYPMYWVLGRAFGLKFVGQLTSASTLDTVSMTVDSNGFYVRTGGTATDHILIGFGPMGSDYAHSAPAASADLFFALPK